MSYSVQLEVFAGPLDLLLFLIKKEEVEIQEVEIAKICDQYLAYVEFMKSLDLDLSSDFLVMAATMMTIKARALVPGDPVDLDEELDPEDDLIQQLLEYKKYKMLARELQEKALARQRRFIVNRREANVGDVPLHEVGVFDLVQAFAKIVKSAGLDKPEVVLKPERPIREYVRDLTNLLRSKDVLAFTQIFSDSQDRSDVIGMFCALLEIMKLGIAQAFQPKTFGEIEIRLVGDPNIALSLTDGDFDSFGSNDAEEDASSETENQESDEEDADSEVQTPVGAGQTGVPQDPADSGVESLGRKLAKGGGRAEKESGSEALEAG